MTKHFIREKIKDKANSIIYTFFDNQTIIYLTRNTKNLKNKFFLVYYIYLSNFQVKKKKFSEADTLEFYKYVPEQYVRNL